MTQICRRGFADAADSSRPGDGSGPQSEGLGRPATCRELGRAAFHRVPTLPRDPRPHRDSHGWTKGFPATDPFGRPPREDMLGCGGTSPYQVQGPNVRPKPQVEANHEPSPARTHSSSSSNRFGSQHLEDEDEGRGRRTKRPSEVRSPNVRPKFEVEATHELSLAQRGFGLRRQARTGDAAGAAPPPGQSEPKRRRASCLAPPQNATGREVGSSAPGVSAIGGRRSPDSATARGGTTPNRGRAFRIVKLAPVRFAWPP
jgi:hypothetical protein